MSEKNVREGWDSLSGDIYVICFFCSDIDYFFCGINFF